MPYQVRIQQPGLSDVFSFDLVEDQLRSRVVDPWYRGESIRVDGVGIEPDEDTTVTIRRTDVPAAELCRLPDSPRAGTRAAALAVMRAGADVTRDYIRGARGSAAEASPPELPHELVTRICRRFPTLVHALNVRSRGRVPLVMKDEYDVQYLMMGVLSLFFTDVRPEEPGPSHGARRPRADFLLFDEEIIVEVKMTRKGLGDQKLDGELSDDFEHYRSHPACKRLIVFVYDPEHRLRQAAQLEKDLSGDKGPFEAHVIIET
jgi:hypothetical protein